MTGLPRSSGRGEVPMMEDRTILKADLKRHKGSLAGVFILVVFVCGALGTVLSV